MTAPPITQLGRYRILAELGRGAMGVVYKAEDPSLNRTVAIKTILIGTDTEERAEYEARFDQEAKAAGALNHANIVTVHDIGREGDVAYMAMELLDGVDLRELMKRGPLPLPRAFDIGAQVAEGLAFAHEHGVVHRDIKPANIMIVRGEHAKIMDFGIARMRLADSLTQAGSMLGSPKYMSPEQAAGQRADHRSDIFSLGVTLYEMVAGQAPFSADDLAQLMFQLSSAAPRPPSAVNPAIPGMFDLIAAKALEKLPEGRYQNARDLAADLRACRAEFAGQKTVVDFEPAKTQAVADKTQKLGATALAGMKPIQLALSRRFDASLALQRLAGAEETASTSQTMRAPTGLKRWLADPQQRTLAAVIAGAIIAGLLIAFV
ncbi:MAG: serine/threonine-protein kinase [Armatimonadota bacterium]